jgi:hypothetical protein
MAAWKHIRVDNSIDIKQIIFLFRPLYLQEGEFDTDLIVSGLAVISAYTSRQRNGFCPLDHSIRCDSWKQDSVL